MERVIKKQASRRKYHYIYKTTCIITNKFYIGMHSTDNLEDGYIGSGKRLWYSINKYGKENHACEILEFLESRELLKEKEKQLVNQDLLNDSLCMNLAIGGEGGHGAKFLTKEQLAKGTATMLSKIWSNPDFIERKRIETSERNKVLHANGTLPPPPTFKGKKHSNETINKMKDSASKRRSDQNSQYGTCWITNDKDNQKIKRGDLIPIGWKLGRSIKLV
jgi:hypothetical protein